MYEHTLDSAVIANQHIACLKFEVCLQSTVLDLTPQLDQMALSVGAEQMHLVVECLAKGVLNEDWLKKISQIAGHFNNSLELD